MSRRDLLKRVEKLEKAAAAKRQKDIDEARVREATSDIYTWVRHYAKSYNEHWQEEGRPSPYEHFPGEDRYPHLVDLFDALDLWRINFIEKSRDMMISWGCVAYFTRHAMTVPKRGVLFQCQKADKAAQLVDYAKCLYRTQPHWLQDAFPLAKPLHKQPKLSLEFAHGGYIIGIPGGADQIRSYHPWGYFNDETAFQPEAGECYNEALSVVSGKIVLNSSAGPGWYADVKRDIVRNNE